MAASALRRHTPDVGAVCGNSARTDLGGGRSEMSVPTANLVRENWLPDIDSRPSRRQHIGSSAHRELRGSAHSEALRKNPADLQHVEPACGKSNSSEANHP